MAKQRGVVQLSGRVDNLCYYQQKRVVGGLVRRVNLAMSERVKTGEEYARLRTSNSFFGGCSMCASAIFNMLGSRSKFLHYPDRQALLTEKLFRYFVSNHDTEDYDQIVFVPQSGFYIPNLFEEVVKNKMSKYMPSVPLLLNNVQLGSTASFVIPSFELEAFCAFNNCKGISFLIVNECYVYGIGRDAITKKFLYPENGFAVVRNPIIWHEGDDDLTISISVGSVDDAFSFAFITALPIIREEGGRAVTKISGSSCRMIGVIPI